MKMSRFIAALVTIFIVSSMARAEEHTYCKTINPKQFNDVWKSQFESGFKVNYDDEEGLFVIYSAEAITTFGFCLTHAQADSLIRIIDKYKEWNIKASKKGVKLDKEIAKLPTKYSFWKMGDDWSFGPSINISVYFFSQSTQKHQLVMLFPKVTSKTNEFDSHTGETLYFDWDNALALRSIFTKEYFKKYKNELAKKKSIEDEFK